MQLLAFLLSMLSGVLFVFAIKFGVKALVKLISSLPRAIPSRYRPPRRPEDNHIQILVLGDIGRSPRMQYHALSVARHARNVDIVAYKETSRHPDLIGNEHVNMYSLAPQPEWIAWGTLPFFLNIPCKVIQQFWTLFYTMMWTTPAAQWIIIQNPPSIPTFHVALLVSLIRGSKVIIDWHNYGHTILAQKPLYALFVPLYKWYEITLGKFLGNANLAVTHAMACELRGRPFNLRNPVYTLHDRPAELFQPISSRNARRKFLERLPETKPHAQNIMDGHMRLIVSSTSWTPDEDFNILLDALVSYANPPNSKPNEDSSSTEPPCPILVIITGKGPDKAKYMDLIQQIQDQGRLPGIKVLTAWLSNRDYATLLACADLGISLHKSSSGVDLPMKVVDMFGAGLPVAAYSAFESFSELVKEGENGCGFETAAQLRITMQRLFSEQGQDELAMLKKGAIREGSLRWDQEWDRVMVDVLGFSEG